MPCHVVDAVAIDKTGEDAYRKLLRSFVREQDADVPRAEVTCRSGDFVVSFRIVTAYVGGEERAARKVVLSGATAQFRTEVVKLLTERDLEGSGGERYVGVEDTQLSFGVEVGLELIAEESCRTAGLSFHAEACVVDVEPQVARLRIGFEAGFQYPEKFRGERFGLLCHGLCRSAQQQYRCGCAYRCAYVVRSFHSGRKYRYPYRI